MSRVRGDGASSLFPASCSRHQRKLGWWFGNDLERLGLSFGTNITDVLKGLLGSEQLEYAAFLKLGDSTAWSSF